MSIDHMRRVWDLDISQPEKIVLLSLADYANHDGMCWPSITMVAKRCSMTERGVYNVIARLENSKFLFKSRRKGASTCYTITLDTPEPHSGQPCTTFTPEPHSPLNHVQVTPEPYSGAPLNHVQVTPEPRSPYTPRTTIRTTNEPPRTDTRPEPELPDWIPKNDWAEFLEMRRKMKKPATAYAKDLLIRKLDELRRQGHNPTALLQQSILNGWQGIFAPRQQTRNYTEQREENRRLERQRIGI